MMCTGSIMAAFQIPIIIVSMFISVYVAEQVGPVSGFIAGMVAVLVGLTIFDMWWSGEFNRKLTNKEVNSDNE